jgi:DNA-binding NtrC family response regulator
MTTDQKTRIAIFDSDTPRRARLRSWLDGQYEVVEAVDANNLVEGLVEGLVDGHDLACAAASRLPAVVSAIKSRNVDVPVIALVPDIGAGIEAIKGGAYDIVCEPIDRDRLEGAIRRAHERQELRRQCRALQKQLEGDEIVPLRELERRAIEKALAATRGSVEKAARMLGMGRATLYRRLATMGTARTA